MAEKLETAKNKSRNILYTGCALFAVLCVVIIIFGFGFMAKSSLPVFLFLVGIAVGMVIGFFGVIYFISYLGLDEELKKSARTMAMGNQQPGKRDGGLVHPEMAEYIKRMKEDKS